MLRRMPGVVTFFFMILCLLANAALAGPRGLTVRLPSESGASEDFYKGSLRSFANASMPSTAVVTW